MLHVMCYILDVLTIHVVLLDIEIKVVLNHYFSTEGADDPFLSGKLLGGTTSCHWLVAHQLPEHGMYIPMQLVDN